MSAADLARLKLPTAPLAHHHQHPQHRPRTLSATETGTGQRIQARSEPELEIP